jgi:predicted nucleotidyltransferase
MGTTKDSVAEALFGKTRRQVLALLFSHPHKAFYLRQIARETGAGVGAVQRELDRLTGAGVITRAPDGRQVYFRANPDSPVFAELQGLMAKTAGIADILRSALLPLEKIDIAFIYGSVARGSQTTYSDIDMMVVGDVTLHELLPLLGTAQERLAREINPTIYTLAEFRSQLADRQHFVSRVLEEPKIFIIGADSELERLAG